MSCLALKVGFIKVWLVFLSCSGSVYDTSVAFVELLFYNSTTLSCHLYHHQLQQQQELMKAVLLLIVLIEYMIKFLCLAQCWNYFCNFQMVEFVKLSIFSLNCSVYWLFEGSWWWLVASMASKLLLLLVVMVLYKLVSSAGSFLQSETNIALQVWRYSCIFYSLNRMNCLYLLVIYGSVVICRYAVVDLFQSIWYNCIWMSSKAEATGNCDGLWFCELILNLLFFCNCLYLGVSGVWPNMHIHAWLGCSEEPLPWNLFSYFDF